jgi:23S rRNA pseudouridine2605 synthase
MLPLTRERLHKFLSRCGISSRREGERLILEGRVKVNGNTVHTLGATVDPLNDQVEVDGVMLQPPHHIYIILNKPKGYITSVKDEKGRPTVMKLLTDVEERVYPVGRLDRDSEGLLLFTNHGELAYRLMHPRYHMEKRYRVRLRGTPKEEDLNRLRKGIRLRDGKTAPAEIRVVSRGKRETEVEVVLKEGRKRQIRRMFKAMGYPVISLVRVAMGHLTLKGLPQGQYRYLSPQEIEELKRELKLAANPPAS